ncbi:flagellar hook basal-body protein [Bremerella cremea]|uniref:flagellar hook-basal body protein n=1 Tax=Bremerella cremea TaxID=1031537 RepID=UPI0031E8E0D1
MVYGLYISAEGAQAQSRRLEVIANNLANVNTPGFKSEFAILEARDSEAINEYLDSPGSGSINNIGGGVMVRETKTSFEPGPITPTGNREDLAIRGDGYFQVQYGDQVLLTRGGNFLFTPDGNLTTQEGYPVLGIDGTPIQVDPEAKAVQPGEYFNDRGEVIIGGEAIPLGIARPQSNADLVKFGKNFFRSLGPVDQIPEEERSAAPGMLERSAANPITEMMAMIETTRAYESNVNMIKTQDEALGNLLGRVLRQS